MNKHYHLIGIGGIGMSAIAQLLLRRGMRVSGSDLKESKIIQELRNLGAQVFIGHTGVNIEGADLVIYSSAIKDDNPEMAQAKRLGVTLSRRAQSLAELMEDKTVITVTGSHGKTTTASLISCLLLEAGLSPTVAIGGILRNIDTNACLGDGRFFVAEADESDGSFLYYRPMYSVITNIDYEHLDYYRNFENELNAFREFLGRSRKDGCIFACGDDANLRDILGGYKNRYILFGLKKGADIYPKNININGLSSEFDCLCKGKFIERFHLALGGEHNISNALSVIALGLELDIGLETIKQALANYKGAKRRLEVKFSDARCMVIDDYAHHPTEIKAALSAVRNLKFNRLIAVFQPHRYTRTKLLLDEFAGSFDSADHIIITDIYSAGEPILKGVSGASIYDKVKKRLPEKEIHFLPKEKITAHILEILKPNDIVVTLGAGDIIKVNDELVERLKN